MKAGKTEPVGRKCWSQCCVVSPQSLRYFLACTAVLSRAASPQYPLTVLKWYLRGIANAILDQAVHVDGMAEDEAMRMMMKDTFQEEREAAGKRTRAQLTATQLSTYFVGFQEQRSLRCEVEQAWGETFSLRRYHDALLSFGSPPTQHVRALMLDLPIGNKQH